ncbi:hypothetical protein SKAU_G00274630 [Synaphobranchus kaupii]|uniref:Nuclease HARBI1 n=1 Tax=Synaphobranchus kaupii TaxID=118154 RepID=A0A9Q1F1A3_SYNKA|nr:hypothetical protein SKAU_G00274630 [Synaphobranchus kaupii]
MRLRCLLFNALEVDHTFVPTVITACTVLHNICLTEVGHPCTHGHHRMCCAPQHLRPSGMLVTLVGFHHVHRVYQQGDEVWMYNPGRRKRRPLKLDRDWVWDGPCTVVQSLSDMLYRAPLQLRC